MKQIKKMLGMAGLMLGLALLGVLDTTAAEAQTYPLSNKPYHCTWQRLDTSGNVIQRGVSLVTFQNMVETDIITQEGTLLTVYANASSATAPIKVVIHPTNGGLHFYQGNISCYLNVSPNASTVEWFGCSNRVRQWCYQPS